MKTIVKYFQHTSGAISVYRAIESEGLVIVTQGYDLSNDTNYTELTEAEYNKAFQQKVTERETINSQIKVRESALSKLVDKADSLLGLLILG